MILNKNIHGNILTKERINDEIRYKVESKGKLYTIYCPNDGSFDLPVGSEIFASYKRSNILWGKKKAVMVSDDAGEAFVRNKKRDLKNIGADIVFFLTVAYAIPELMPFPKHIDNVAEFMVGYNVFLMLLVFLVWITTRFLKAISNSSLFATLYHKKEKKSERKKKYNRYIKENFTPSAKFLNKKLKDDDKQKLISFVNHDQDYSEGETILIEDIIDKQIIKIHDIPYIDIKKIEKITELKYSK